MIYIVALGSGFKCPRKIQLNTQWVGGGGILADVYINQGLIQKGLKIQEGQVVMWLT